jgi:hypothetical protein
MNHPQVEASQSPRNKEVELAVTGFAPPKGTSLEGQTAVDLESGNGGSSPATGGEETPRLALRLARTNLSTTNAVADELAEDVDDQE